MKQGSKTLQDLCLEVNRQNDVKKDFCPVNGQAFFMTGQAELNIGDYSEFQELGITDNAHSQIANKLEIPGKYYNRMLVEDKILLSTNVNTWLNQSKSKYMIRILDNKVRALLSDRYQCIDNYEIMNCIMPIFKDANLQLSSWEITENKFYLKAIFEDRQAEIVRGDVVQSGISIQNSEVGLGSFEVQPFLHRLVCSNGMIINDFAYKRKHVGIKISSENEDFTLYSNNTLRAHDRAFMMKINDIVRRIISADTFEEMVRNLQLSKQEKIEGKPEKIIQELGKKYSFNEGDCTDIFKYLCEGGDYSKYGAAQAITRYSQDVENYDKATDLETVGGSIIMMPYKDWERINKLAM